ncbi:MAK10-like protein [Tanacetum coccineum]
MNKVENGDGNKSIETSENEEVVEAPGSEPIVYYLKHKINEQLIKGLVNNNIFNNSRSGTRVGKKKGKEYKVLPGGLAYDTILKKKITKKEDIGGNFEIPCSIGNLKHVNALVDQGSDVNVIPYFTYMILTDERPAETDIRLSLASHSYIYPLGITEDVLVRLYLIRRSLEVLRKFHWMILGGRFSQLSHVLLENIGDNWLETASQIQRDAVTTKIKTTSQDSTNARVQNFEIQFLKEAAKFVRDFKSLTKEADESFAKHKALELEIERLLRAVIERLQAQLGDLKGKSKDTPCVSDTLDPLSQKLEMRICSRLDLTYAPSIITTQQPTERDLDLLFEAMYDDYIGGQPSATPRTTLAAQAPSVREAPTTSTTIYYGTKKFKADKPPLYGLSMLRRAVSSSKRLDVGCFRSCSDNIKPLLEWNLCSDCKNGSYKDLFFGICCPQIVHCVSNRRGMDETASFVLVYVDDIIFGSTNPKYTQLFSGLMKSHFEMSIMGGKDVFSLVILRSQSPGGIFINQSNYVLEILKKYGIETFDPATTPMKIKDKLDLDRNGILVDATKYRA